MSDNVRKKKTIISLRCSSLRTTFEVETKRSRSTQKHFHKVTEKAFSVGGGMQPKKNPFQICDELPVICIKLFRYEIILKGISQTFVLHDFPRVVGAQSQSSAEKKEFVVVQTTILGNEANFSTL